MDSISSQMLYSIEECGVVVMAGLSSMGENVVGVKKGCVNVGTVGGNGKSTGDTGADAVAETGAKKMRHFVSAVCGGCSLLRFM